MSNYEYFKVKVTETRCAHSIWSTMLLLSR